MRVLEENDAHLFAASTCSFEESDEAVTALQPYTPCTPLLEDQKFKPPSCPSLDHAITCTYKSVNLSLTEGSEIRDQIQAVALITKTNSGELSAPRRQTCRLRVHGSGGNFQKATSIQRTTNNAVCRIVSIIHRSSNSSTPSSQWRSSLG